MAEEQTAGAPTSGAAKPCCCVSAVGEALAGAAWSVLTMPKRAAKTTFDIAMTAAGPRAAGHLIQSSREFLLAIRSLVDYEIRMADRAMARYGENPPAEEQPKGD
ncbi:MAG: hypothetical protein N2111_09925 [Candidatus Sumerlaeaceae bacterium]|nr:hypothetical protein [Candidatus Sumerlaeaceae bacterium]